VSLSRLMVRALACVALQQQSDDEVAPTMAEDRVFDSRLDPLMFEQFGDKPMPGITVYTDDDTGELLNRGSGDGPFRRWVDLRVEIVIGSFDTEIVDGEKNIVFDLPMTDAQLEAQLDLFEAQVKWALWQLPRKYTAAFRAYVVRIESVTSHATRDEANNKFASRRMHFKLEIPDDCPPNVYGLMPGERIPELIPFCEDLSKFPAPWIRPMLQALCNSPGMQGVLNVLAGNKNPTAFLPLLRRIGINVDAVKPEADPNLLAAEGRKQGPDGRIEVTNLLELPQ
jgi:hypothetical protein